MTCEFTAEELDVAAALLERRYGNAIAFELAEVDLATEGDPAGLTCAAFYWEARGAHFVVCKLSVDRFRGEFFEGTVPGGAGEPEFDDLGDCVTALLRTQSDRERARAGAVSGATAATLAGDEYHGPTLI